MPHVQSTVQPNYLQKPTGKPLTTNYHFKPAPVDDFEPVAYDPYEISVTTLDTHQHLTETTPIDHIQRNVSTIKPVTYDSFIPTTSSKPIHEILHNMNRTSLQLLLTKLKDANYLPKTFQMNKVDNSLRTLAKVLGELKKGHKPVKNYEFAPVHQLSHPLKVHPIKDSYENVKPILPIHSNEGKVFHFGFVDLSKHLHVKLNWLSMLFLFSAPGPQSGKYLCFFFNQQNRSFWSHSKSHLLKKFRRYLYLAIVIWLISSQDQCDWHRIYF